MRKRPIILPLGKHTHTHTNTNLSGFHWQTGLRNWVRFGWERSIPSLTTTTTTTTTPTLTTTSTATMTTTTTSAMTSTTTATAATNLIKSALTRMTQKYKKLKQCSSFQRNCCLQLFLIFFISWLLRSGLLLHDPGPSRTRRSRQQHNNSNNNSSNNNNNNNVLQSNFLLHFSFLISLSTRCGTSPMFWARAKLRLLCPNTALSRAWS